MHIASVTDECATEHLWNDTDRGNNEVPEEKFFPVPLSPPQMPYGLAWFRNQSSAGISRCLTARVKAGPAGI